MALSELISQIGLPLAFNQRYLGVNGIQLQALILQRKDSLSVDVLPRHRDALMVASHEVVLQGCKSYL